MIGEKLSMENMGIISSFYKFETILKYISPYKRHKRMTNTKDVK